MINEKVKQETFPVEKEEEGTSQVTQYTWTDADLFERQCKVTHYQIKGKDSYRISAWGQYRWDFEDANLIDVLVNEFFNRRPVGRWDFVNNKAINPEDY